MYIPYIIFIKVVTYIQARAWAREENYYFSGGGKVANLHTVHVGSRWGRVVCIRKENKEVKVNLGTGVTETAIQLYLGFRCDCGVEFDVKGVDFRGKRWLVDCGRCGLGDGQDVKTQVLLHVQTAVLRALKKEARSKGVSVNQLVRDVLVAHVEGRKVVEVPEINHKQRIDVAEMAAGIKEQAENPTKGKSRIW